jgi:hypothetical protein
MASRKGSGKKWKWWVVGASRKGLMLIDLAAADLELRVEKVEKAEVIGTEGHARLAQPRGH